MPFTNVPGYGKPPTKPKQKPAKDPRGAGGAVGILTHGVKPTRPKPKPPPKSKPSPGPKSKPMPKVYPSAPPTPTAAERYGAESTVHPWGLRPPPKAPKKPARIDPGVKGAPYS